MKYKMKKITLLGLGLILSTALFNLNASAQSLLAGTYQCNVVGKKTISDGRGSSITYKSGTLTIDEEGSSSYSSKVTFNIKGRKPRVETLTVSGSGILNDIESNDSLESASTSFKLTPSKKVIYRGINLASTASFEIEAEDIGIGDDEESPDFGDLAVVQTATGSVRSKIGAVKLSCSN